MEIKTPEVTIGGIRVENLLNNFVAGFPEMSDETIEFLYNQMIEFTGALMIEHEKRGGFKNDKA